MKKIAFGILLAGTTVIAGCGSGGDASDPLVIGGKHGQNSTFFLIFLGNTLKQIQSTQ